MSQQYELGPIITHIVERSGILVVESRAEVVGKDGDNILTMTEPFDLFRPLVRQPGEKVMVLSPQERIMALYQQAVSRQIAGINASFTAFCEGQHPDALPERIRDRAHQAGGRGDTVTAGKLGRLADEAHTIRETGK